MKDQQSLNKTRKVRWLRLKMKKCFETLQKHTMGVIFLNTQNSHWSDLVLTVRRNFSGTRPKSACGKSLVVDFRS